MSSEPGYRIDDPRIGAGRVPIAGDSPAGDDAREDSAFEAIEAEVRRMETDGPTAVRWGEVAGNSLSLIEGRSKDLLVAAWLSYALYQTESYRGLAIGLTVLGDMIDAHWDGLQPPLRRERGRVAAVEWLVGRLAPSVASRDPGDDEALDVVVAYEALDTIDRLLEAKLTKEQAALGELVRALRPHAEAARRQLEAVEKAAADTEAVEPTPAETDAAPAAAASAAPAAPAAPSPSAVPAPAPAKPAASAMPAVAAEIDTVDADRALSQLDTAMRKLAAALRGADPTDPRAYLYVRAANWFGIKQPPPHQGGKTMLPAPSAERLAAIETMRAAEQHQEALLNAESMAASLPFWLNGQRIVAQTMGTLGAAFEPARRSVVGMTAALVTRLPQLLDLRFADDSPFADDATRRWLAEAVPTSGGGAANGAGHDDDALAAVLAEARGLAGTGKAREGLDVLSASLRGVSAGRERFAWQASQAEYCLENGFIAAAVSLVDHLDLTAETLDLERWEPALAARVAALRYRAFRHAEAEKLVGPERRRVALEAALARLARIDVAAAAGLPQ